MNTGTNYTLPDAVDTIWDNYCNVDSAVPVLRVSALNVRQCEVSEQLQIWVQNLCAVHVGRQEGRKGTVNVTIGDTTTHHVTSK